METTVIVLTLLVFPPAVTIEKFTAALVIHALIAVVIAIYLLRRKKNEQD